jgi:hypothetical protein
MQLEKDLECLLRRERPPAGFAARVVRRVEKQDRRGRLSSLVAAAVLLAMIGGGWMTHHEIERRRGERAKAEVLLALRITGAKMHAAREHVRDLGTH